jgi:hypothetical protein
MPANSAEVSSGLFFIAAGLFYGCMSYFGAFGLEPLPIGRAVSMGPGYFPVVLSSLLVAMGLFVVGRGFLRAQGPAFSKIAWRPLAFLALAVLGFSFCIRPLGLAPAIFVSAVLASCADPKMKWTSTLLTALGLTAFCTVVFAYGVRLPLPIFGTLFGS